MISDMLIQKWINDVKEEIEQLHEVKKILISMGNEDNILPSYSSLMKLEENELTGTHKSVGENIKIRRESKGLTQEELAAAVGLGRSMIAQIERGTKSASLQLGVAIAKALGCEITDLVV